jgi:TRAP-type transport system periplasmic protein
MKGRELIKAACVVCLLMLMGGPLILVDDVNAEEPIKLSFSTMFPKGHLQAVLNQMYCDEIEKRTNGKVKITLYPGGTLTSAPKCYDGVVKGLSDIGMSCPLYVAGRFPASESFEMPSDITSGWECTKIYNEFYKEFQLKEYEDVHVLYLHGPSRNALQMRRVAVRKPDDLKGLVLRASGAAAAVVNAWGATPRAMSMGEAYEALSKGVVEGQFSNPETLKGWRHSDVVKYVTIPPISAASCQFVTMNKEKWNSLPDGIKKVFDEVSSEWAEKHGIVWHYYDVTSLDHFRNLEGREMIKIGQERRAEWEKPLEPVLQKYVEEKTAMGLPAADYLEFINKRAAYWAPKRPSDEYCVKWVEDNLLKK